MAKMNWDRVRQWDQVRGGLSEAELSDRRDDEWFAREQVREEARAQRRPGASVPSKPGSETVVLGTKARRKRALREKLAGQFGVSAAQVASAQQALSAAESGLVGMKPGEKRAAVARRLGMTAAELKILRKALAGDSSVRRETGGVLIRTAAGAKLERGSTTSVKGAGAAKRGASQTTKPSKSASSALRGSPLPPTTSVFVTLWGNVVHLHHDCPSSRGFRHAGEPDPDIYRVQANDPSCRGRRVCGTCSNASPYMGRRLGSLLERLHGKPFDEKEWQRSGWNRPRPSGKPLGRK